MKVINQPAEWFTKDSSETEYNSCKTLAEKTVFLYSYLKTVADKSFEKNNALFKMAFLFADAISQSDLPYKNYKALIDPEQNPFVMYLKKSSGYINECAVFNTLLAIIQEKVDVSDGNSWIYEKEFFKDEEYPDKLEEIGCCYVANPRYYVNDPAKFEVRDALKMTVLEIYWLFGVNLDGEEYDDE